MLYDMENIVLAFYLSGITYMTILLVIEIILIVIFDKNLKEETE